MPTHRYLPVLALATAFIVSACAGSSPTSETAGTPVPGTLAPQDVTSPTSLSTDTVFTAPTSGDPDPPPPDDAEPATVVSVTDGDTIRVSLEGSPDTPVRLIGINAPETGECFAEEAARGLSDLAPEGTAIGMTRDVSEVDEFGRLLRYLWRGGMSVNEEMVRRGLATARRYPPDTAMAETLERAQDEARESQLGLWGPDVCGTRSDAGLSILAVEYDAPGDDSQNLNQEWVEIRNDGAGPVDLTGWEIKDESAGNRYRFPAGFTLAPDETVTVRSGCGDDFGTELFWCSVGAAIWNNDGDTAFLTDPNGNIHAVESYQGEAESTAEEPPPPLGLIGGGGDCEPSYPDVCIPSPPPDLDCGQISHRRFRVLPPDPHGFDGNEDGVGCESG
jgi:micrococcal nuclease